MDPTTPLFRRRIQPVKGVITEVNTLKYINTGIRNIILYTDEYKKGESSRKSQVKKKWPGFRAHTEQTSTGS